MYPEELFGEILNDTMYSRDRSIEERFNIKITAETISLFDLHGRLSRDVRAGEAAFDEYMLIDRERIPQRVNVCYTGLTNCRTLIWHNRIGVSYRISNSQ